IGRLETSTLETLSFNLARDLRNTCDVNQIIGRMVAFAPGDDVFVRQFREASVSRRESARYILKELEVNTRTTEELQVAPPSRVHVEHIYPQTPQQEERWTDHNAQIN